MKRRAFAQEYLGRFALTFLLLCLIVYTLFHALGNTPGSLLTTPAKSISDTQILGGRAWLFRDETLLTVPTAGLVNPIAESGSKVGKNAPITEIYTGVAEEDREEAQAQLDLLNRTLRVLEESLADKNASASKADGYRSEAIVTLQEIRMAIREGNWSLLSQLEDELLITLNRYGALSDSPDAIETALASVQAQIESYLVGTKTTITNELTSAYYYGMDEVDGYEQSFNEAALESLTPESFAALKESRPQSTESTFVVGKLCYGYSWHLAVEFAEGGSLFEDGVSYRIRFPENNGLELVLLCERTLMGEGGESVVIFRSDVTPAAFRYLRSQSAEITVGETDGLYIPRQALTELDGYTGVYVFEESTLQFRRITICYTGDGYYIALSKDPHPELSPDPKETDTSGIPKYHYLELNDLIVVSGKNLYNGKVYQ